MIVKEFPFARLELHNDFILATPSEGVTMGRSEVDVIIEMGNEYYTDYYGYIGNRKNLNATNPSVAAEAIQEMPLMCCFAYVCYAESTRQMIEMVERKYYPNFPVETFSSVEDAKRWVLQQVSRKRKESPLD